MSGSGIENLELERLADSLACGILCCRRDDSLTIAYANGPFYRMLGFAPGEVTALLDERTGPVLREAPPGGRDRIAREIAERGFAGMELRLTRKDGRRVWAACRVTLCRSRDGGRDDLCGFLVDITQTKRAQDELVATEERYRMILEHAADPIVDCDLKTGRFYYSPAFLSKFGQDFPGGGDLMRDLARIPLIYEADRKRLLRDARRLLEGESLDDGEFRFRVRSGSYIWCNVHPAVFFDGQGGASRLIVVLSDIDRRKKEAISLRRQAEHDLLTGLYNRVTAANRIDAVLRQSTRDERHALFVVDIDNFKTVNDRFGHLRGDELIVETAAVIRGLFRAEDVVARIGGDEFVIFLRNIASVDLIVKKAENLGRAFRESAGCGLCDISGSIGIAFYPQDGTSYEELFRKADAAMYTAKNSGKGSFRIYTQEIEDLSPFSEGFSFSAQSTASAVSSGVPSAGTESSARSR